MTSYTSMVHNSHPRGYPSLPLKRVHILRSLQRGKLSPGAQCCHLEQLVTRHAHLTGIDACRPILAGGEDSLLSALNATLSTAASGPLP
jgi:hypothetical protein